MALLILRMGDADVTEMPLLFPFAHDGQLRGDHGTVEEADVVHLHQIKLWRAQPLLGFFHLRDEGGVVVGANLGGEEYLVPHFHFSEQVADHRLRGTVGGGGIDQSSAAGEEGVDDLDAFGTLRRVVLNIKNDRGADADDRQRFLGFRDQAGQQRFGCALRH